MVMDINKIFKIGILVLGFGYLAYMYCPHTNQVGRYRGLSGGILDTTNADWYSLAGTSHGARGNWIKHNPFTAKREVIKITGNLKGF
jgi:hypothetical protein